MLFDFDKQNGILVMKYFSYTVFTKNPFSLFCSFMPTLAYKNLSPKVTKAVIIKKKTKSPCI